MRPGHFNMGTQVLKCVFVFTESNSYEYNIIYFHDIFGNLHEIECGLFLSGVEVKCTKLNNVLFLIL